jgi:hypothetical protein
VIPYSLIEKKEKDTGEAIEQPRYTPSGLIYQKTTHKSIEINYLNFS